MLQDSKVLPTVEKWSAPNKEGESPPDSESNSPKMETEVVQEEKLEKAMGEMKVEEATEEVKKEEPEEIKKIVPEEIKTSEEPKKDEEKPVPSVKGEEEEMEVRRSVGMDADSPQKGISFPTSVEEIENLFEEGEPQSSNLVSPEKKKVDFEEEDEREEEVEFRRSVGMDFEIMDRRLLAFPNRAGKRFLRDLANLFEDDIPFEKPKRLLIPQVPQLNYEEEVSF